MKKDLQERFCNIDTFIVSPYLITLGITGLINIQYFVSTLSVGLICSGLYYFFRNRIARMRRDQRLANNKWV